MSKSPNSLFLKCLLDENGEPIYGDIAKDIELFTSLTTKLDASNDRNLCYEIACFFAIISIDPEFDGEVPLKVYQVLVESLSSDDIVVAERTLDTINETVHASFKSRYFCRKILTFHDHSIMGAILRRVGGFNESLKVKSCRLIAKIHGRRIREQNYYLPFTNALPFVLSCFNSDNNELISVGAAALSSFMDDTELQIMEVLQADNNIPNRLSQLLLNSDETVVYFAEEAIKAVVDGTIEQAQTLIDAGVLPNLLWLLDHPNKSIVANTCSVISRITLGSEEQIQAVIDAAIIPKLVAILRTEGDEGHYDASWAITQIMEEGSVVQKDYIINEGAVSAICQAFTGEGKTLELLRPVVTCLTAAIHFCQEDDVRKFQLLNLLNSQATLLMKLESATGHDQEMAEQIMLLITSLLM